MPRDSGGAYALPPSYLAVSGQTILASQHNPPLEDLGSSMTNSLDRTGLGGMLANLNMATNKVTNLGDGSNAQDAVTVSQLGSAFPVGMIVDYAGATPPVGWLLCYGQAISRTDYAALFTAIGTAYGAGDGTTTFLLPDCRGRLRAGRDNMGGTDAERLSGFWSNLARTLGGVFGTASHILITGQMPTHSHTVSGTAASNGAHTHSVSGGTSEDGFHAHNISGRSTAGGGVNQVAINSSGSAAGDSTVGNGSHTHTITGTAASNGAHTHTVSGTAANQGSSQAHTNTQPTIIFNTIIKAV